MNLILIAAIGQNKELGYKNNLIWHLPEDLKFFKQITLGHKVVMGKKTYLSLPHKLPDRENIVITHSNIPNVTVFHSIKDFLNYYKDSEEPIFIIGGAQVYKEFIKDAKSLYLTEIEATSKADTFFPDFNKEEWIKEEIDEGNDNGIKYKHVLYKRRNV